MIRIAENNNEKDELNNLNDKSDTEKDAGNVAKAGAEKGKEEAGKAAKKLAEKAAKNPEVMSAIAAALPVILIVLLVILIIIIVIGLIGFFVMMPSMIRGKIQQFGQSMWADFKGFWTGDSITASVTQDDVKSLAQYIQNMGYDIEGFGFADVTYTSGDSISDTNGQTKDIENLDGVNGEQKYNYLTSYIAADQATYAEAHYSVNGMFKSLKSTALGVFTKQADGSTDINSYSTGLLNIKGQGIDVFADGKKYVKVVPSEKKMYIYSDAIRLAFWKIQWGKTFAFDLSNWTAIYGRPTELFLAVHLSTMMPDLANEIATSPNFNTKVNMNLQKVNIHYATTVGETKFEDTPTGTSSKTDAQKNMDTFVDTYLHKGLYTKANGGKDLYKAMLDKIGNDTELKMQLFLAIQDQIESDITGFRSIWGINYRTALVNAKEIVWENHVNNFLKSDEWQNWFKDQLSSIFTSDDFKNAVSSLITDGITSVLKAVDVLKNLLAKPSDFLVSLLTKYLSGVTNAIGTILQMTGIDKIEIGKFTIPILNIEFPGITINVSDIANKICDLADQIDASTYVYATKGSANVSVAGLNLTNDEFQELSRLIHDGVKGTYIYWPYITSVTKHWYYEDINFMHGYTYGAYRKAKTATKTIKYEAPNEDQDSAEAYTSLSEKYDISLNAELQSNQGIFYQVCEPETYGPNQNIKDLFSDKYYKYDGTITTAEKIAKAKALDEGDSSCIFEGQEVQIEAKDRTEYDNAKRAEALDANDTSDDAKYKDDAMCKQSVSFTQDKTNPLSAFTILEKVNTEASDEAYRDLKQLMVSLGYFTEEEMSQNENQLLLWIADDGTPGDTRTWVTDKSSVNGDSGKSTNNYGLKVSKLASTMSIVAPGDAEVIKNTGDSITLKFKPLSDETVELMEYRYKGYFKTIDQNKFTGMTLTIKGTNVTFTATGDVTRGSEIGVVTGTQNNSSIEMQMNKEDKTVVDNIETYMETSYTKTDEDNLIAKKKKEENHIYGNQYNDNGSNDYAGGDEDNIPAEDEKVTASVQDIYKGLIKRGLTPEGACALLGIMKHESGFNLNALNKKDGGYGLIQWTGGRRTNLENWCTTNGKDYTTLDGQLDFFIYELKGSYSKAGGYHYPVYEYVTESGHTLEDALYMYFAHDEAGTDFSRESGRWNKPYYSGGPLTSTLYAARLSSAKGYYNIRDQLG